MAESQTANGASVAELPGSSGASPRRVESIDDAVLSSGRLGAQWRRLVTWAQMDRAVVFGIVSKLWSMLAGPVTALLITAWFTPDLQGYYYTFGSVVALQVFVELGLGTVIIQFASHEWSRLRLNESGDIVGDEKAISRLVSLARIAVRWYAVGGVIVAVGLGAGGYLFFSHGSAGSVHWSAPWLALCLLTGVMLCLVPIWSLLEGCNQVASVYAYRFVQGLFGTVSVWAAILVGAGLWTASVSAVVSLLCAGVFLTWRYSRFLRALLLSEPAGPRIHWTSEILPMQWRIAVSWLSGYFLFYFFTPVLFKYHGPVLAGQMGMTWSLVSALSAISSAWLYPKAPTFGVLIAQRDYRRLDGLFWRVTIVVLVVVSMGAVAAWGLVYFLNVCGHPLAGRLLPPLPTAIFLLATILQVFSFPFSTYLHAHKKAPLLVISIMAAVLVGTSNMILGKRYGAAGMAIGYLVVNGLAVPCIILVWWRCRAIWHREPAVQGWIM